MARVRSIHAEPPTAADHASQARRQGARRNQESAVNGGVRHQTSGTTAETASYTPKPAHGLKTPNQSSYGRSKGR